MSARERILNRVRRAVRTGGSETARAEAVAGRITGHTRVGPIPAMARANGNARITQFIAKAEAVHATLERLASLADLPAALSAHLRERNLPQAIRMGSEPLFAGLDWGGLDVSRGPGRVDEPATLSRAVFGMAETGTLVLTSGPENPVTLTFLGETHFVALDAADLMDGFEGMWAALRARKADHDLDPRTVNMVTGPSRTADIEQKLELGAHGPCALHVFLIGGAAN